MNLPSIVTIDGVDVFIKLKPLDDTEGEFTPVTMTINLNQNMCPQLYRRVLMHELTHAILFISARGLADYIVAIDDEDQIGEIIAEQIGERLYEVLKANPKLREYLWGCCGGS
jgi:hypothetical protein